MKNTEQDIPLIKFYVHCFDRPAFQDDIRKEGRMEDFDKAIEDTIITLNTGVLRTRDGDIIKQEEGKSFVRNSEWREKLYNVVDILTAIRRRLMIAKNEHVYSFCSDKGYEEWYCFEDRELEEWFKRNELKRIMKELYRSETTKKEMWEYVARFDEIVAAVLNILKKGASCIIQI